MTGFMCWLLGHKQPWHVPSLGDSDFWDRYSFYLDKPHPCERCGTPTVWITART